MCHIFLHLRQAAGQVVAIDLLRSRFLLYRSYLSNDMATNLYQLAYGIAYFTFVVGVLSSFARFYSRALVVKSWGWDDSASCAVFVWPPSPWHLEIRRLLTSCSF